jgi:hypothetical protein
MRKSPRKTENDAMTRQHVLMFVAGLTIGVVALYLLHASLNQPTQAQPAQPALIGPVGRFQISSSVAITKGETPAAYVLDTQTGEVFQVVGKNAPEPIGTVARPQPKK